MANKFHISLDWFHLNIINIFFIYVCYITSLSTHPTTNLFFIELTSASLNIIFHKHRIFMIVIQLFNKIILFLVYHFFAFFFTFIVTTFSTMWVMIRGEHVCLPLFLHSSLVDDIRYFVTFTDWSVVVWRCCFVSRMLSFNIIFWNENSKVRRLPPSRLATLIHVARLETCQKSL